MTTAGLGQTTLAVEQGGASTDCSTELAVEHSLFRLPGVPPNGVDLRVRVPADLVPEAGMTVEGKIVVLVPAYDPLELPLKVTKVASAGAAASGWVLGIVVPALLTAALAYFGHKWTNAWSARRKLEEEFIAYKDQKFEDLRRFFTIFYPTIYLGATPDVQPLAEELRSQHIIDRIPYRIRRRLETALARSDVTGTVAALGDAFPHWKRQLETELARARGRPAA